MITRRSAIALFAAGVLVPAFRARASTAPLVQVYRDPSCGCCGAWIANIARAGYRTHVTETADVEAVKTRRGVPELLWACHTAIVEDYVLEGHVPAQALARLLTDRPSALGLAVPGMPAGSPGMEAPGAPPEEYAVILIGKGEQQKTFMRFRGDKPL